MAGRGMSNTRVCSVCKRTFAKEEIITINAKNYCPKCKAERDQDAEDYKNLMIYIDELSDYDRTIMPIVGTQIKKMKQDGGITNGQILSTLRYIYELKEPPIKFLPEYGIANVPYFFREAQLFYRKNSNLASTTEQEIQESLNCEPIRITIKRSTLIQQQKEYEEENVRKENRVVINLDDIELEEDEVPFEDKAILNYKNKLEYEQRNKYKKSKTSLGGVKDWDN